MIKKTTEKVKKTATKRTVKRTTKSQTSKIQSAEKVNSVVDRSIEDNDSLDKKFKLKIGLIPIIVALFVVAIIIAIIFTNKNIHLLKKTVETQIEKEELESIFNYKIVDPIDVNQNDIIYGIENDSIAKITYKKEVSNGSVMNFVMRSSSSTEDIENSIGLDVEFAYTPIMMTVVCDDGSEVPVESKVALDEDGIEMKYMKSLWYDNDKYYSMVTDNLVTREDFLQEVNRVIIANHENF